VKQKEIKIFHRAKYEYLANLQNGSYALSFWLAMLEHLSISLYHHTTPFGAKQKSNKSKEK
jgi:hypothetical protein